MTKQEAGINNKGTGVVTHVRRFCVDRAGNKCERCGWSEINLKTGMVPIQLHHKRGFYENRPEDLEVLCPNCHSLTDTFGNLNHGKGRKHRTTKVIAG